MNERILLPTFGVSAYISDEGDLVISQDGGGMSEPTQLIFLSRREAKWLHQQMDELIQEMEEDGQ